MSTLIKKEKIRHNHQVFMSKTLRKKIMNRPTLRYTLSKIGKNCKLKLKLAKL